MLKEKEGSIFLKNSKRTNRILTLLTFPNFPILLVNITLLFQCHEGRGFWLCWVLFEWVHNSNFSGNTDFVKKKRCVGLLPVFLQTPTNRCKSYVKKEEEADMWKEKYIPVSSESQGKIPWWLGIIMKSSRWLQNGPFWRTKAHEMRVTEDTSLYLWHQKPHHYVSCIQVSTMA